MAYGAPYWAPPSTEITPEEELAMLRSEADALKKELESIESRIQGLEKKE
jgi:ubiquinone biosynthesis protein UbiJ